MDKENDSEQPGSIEPQRRSSVMSAGTGPAAVSRRSSAGASGSSAAATHMFSRLSLRISDALGKLSRRSELPELPEDSAAEQEEEEDVQPVMTATATEEHSIQAAIQEKAANAAAEEEEKEEEGKTPQRQGKISIVSFSHCFPPYYFLANTNQCRMYLLCVQVCLQFQRRQKVQPLSPHHQLPLLKQKQQRKMARRHPHLAKTCKLR